MIKSRETRIIIDKNCSDFGISFGRNDLNLEGHFQMGYNSKTIKNFGPVEKRLILPENLPSTITESNEQTVLTSRSDTEATDA